jgi:hypothetical protein
MTMERCLRKSAALERRIQTTTGALDTSIVAGGTATFGCTPIQNPPAGEWLKEHIPITTCKMRLAITFVLCAAAAFAQGRGCTTTRYIDADCDGYGTGKRADATYPLGANTGTFLDPPYNTGDLPDADDTDPTVNTTASWKTKYGWDDVGNTPSVNNAAMASFLAARKGFTNTGRIFYLSLAGDDATGAVNDPTHPYRTTYPISVLQADRQGGAVIVREGDYTDLYFGTNDWVTKQFSGSPGHRLYIMAFPGELVRGTYSAVPIGMEVSRLGKDNNGYITYDGLTLRSRTPNGGNSVSGQDSKDVTLINMEIVGFQQTIFSNHTESLTITRCVFHEMGEHAIYLAGYNLHYPLDNTFNRPKGPAGAVDFDFAQDAIEYLAGTSLGASDGVVFSDNVLYSTGGNGYEPIHINWYIQNVTIERNIVSHGGGRCIGLQTGVYHFLIRNNVCIANSSSGITMNLYGPDGFPATIRYGTIEYNTVWVPAHTDFIRGVSAGGPGIYAADLSDVDYGHYIKDITVKDNIIVTDNAYSTDWVSAALWFGRNSYPATWTVKNNVFWSHHTGAALTDRVMLIDSDGDPGGAGAGDYNLDQFAAYGFTEVSGNVYADPLFMAADPTWTETPELFDFRLLAGSPAINRGEVGLDIDVKYNPRVGNADAGAYEYGGVVVGTGREAAVGGKPISGGRVVH